VRMSVRFAAVSEVSVVHLLWSVKLIKHGCVRCHACRCRAGGVLFLYVRWEQARDEVVKALQQELQGVSETNRDLVRWGSVLFPVVGVGDGELWPCHIFAPPTSDCVLVPILSSFCCVMQRVSVMQLEDRVRVLSGVRTRQPFCDAHMCFLCGLGGWRGRGGERRARKYASGACCAARALLPGQSCAYQRPAVVAAACGCMFVFVCVCAFLHTGTVHA
jgi:hypothetical protein